MRERLKRPPRLALPVVEDEVRPDCGIGGVGSGSSSTPCFAEFFVEDLPRLLRCVGPANTGEDLPDLVDAVESRCKAGMSWEAKSVEEGANVDWDGDGNGEGSSLLL